MQRLNPNSSIRSGYKFEDLYVLKLCIEWLKAPEKFKKILIQYVPDEIQNSRFSIDDVVVVDKENNYLFHQLKYKQNPASDLWTFDQLLEKGLLKWIKSFKDLKSVNVAGCYFITNGAMGTDITQCYSKEKINLAKIKSGYPSTYHKLNPQSFGIPLLKEFFQKFSFQFNFPEKHAFENELRNILYNDLKVIKSGVDSLLLHIANQGSEKEPKVLTLTEIRSHLSWDNPRPLNQNFEVPADFEFFDKHTHEDIINDLKNPQGGIKVIIGKPGTGKSTYLSKLYTILQKDYAIPAARHHYHINPKDSSFRDRLNADRVKEALRAQFKKQKKEVIGELSYENTEHTPLKEFLEKIAGFYNAESKSFVLIIDGLDHVIREGRHEDELREFLNEILYPQAGLWIIFGTQEMAVPFFPNVVYQYAQTEKWIEIKGLKKNAVEKIILSKHTGLNLGRNKEFYKEIVDEIYNKTAGNPLHLRYMLSQLKNHAGNISSYDLRGMLPYKNEIKEYYYDLWKHLPLSSKTMCFAIGTLDFKLQEEQLFQLAAYFLRVPSKISEAYMQVKHLVRIDLHGISVFHNSFLVFLLNQPELDQQKHLLFKHIKNWLKRSDNDDLKWSELAKIEYYLGNPAPLLSLDKNWVVNSFLECRDQDQIQKLLDLAVEASFRQKNFEKVIYFNLLDVNFANRHYNLYDTLQKIWVTSFASRKKIQIAYPDFSKFNHYQVSQLLIALKDKGTISEIPQDAIDRINEFFADRDYEKDAVIRSWLDVLINFDIKISRVHTFLIQFRKSKDSAQYFSYYLSHSIIHKQYSNVKELLKLKTHPGEKRSIIEVLVRADLNNNLKKWKLLIFKLKGSGYANHLEVFYSLLNDLNFSLRLNLSKQSQFPSEVELGSNRSTEVLELYRSNFYIGLSLCMVNKEATVLNWTKSKDKRWSVTLMNVLLTASKYLAESIKDKQKVEVKHIIKLFNGLTPIDYHNDYELYELRRTILPYCLIELIELTTYVNIRNGLTNCLGINEVEIINNCEWLSQADMTSIWNIETITLSDEAFAFLINKKTNEIKNEIIPFNKRADKYADLAILAKNLEKPIELSQLLYKAAENIVSYGHHKYMLLHKLIRSMEICGEAGSLKVKQYIRQIAKYVYNIRELTDGDETGGFIYDYSSLLAKHDKSLLYNFYFHSLKERDYYQSEHLFADIITTLKFSHEISFAIGNTAIDQNSYNTLLFLSKTNADSKKLLRHIWTTFGKPDYPDKNHSSYTSSKSRKKRQNYNKVTPESLSSFLANLKSDGFTNDKYERTIYLSNWVKYWLGKTNYPIIKTLKSLKEIVEPQFDQVNMETLLHIFPYAYQTDKGFAFNCLMWAQANGSSWGEEYTRSMKDSREIWMKVIKYFPARIDEFFEKSILSSGRYYETEATGQVPIPKGVQFFVDSGRLPMAEKITEYYLSSIDMLFPDVNLQIPDFISKERKISEFEILMTRFVWLSPIIRERAGLYLSRLLENDKSGRIHKQFLNWFSGNRLESYACNGLLVIIKSLQNKNSYSHKFIRVKQLGEVINVRCMATDLLLMNISERLNQPPVMTMPYVMSWSNSVPDIDEEKFFKIVLTHLPFVFQDYINQLQSKTEIPVWALWYRKYKEECEFQKLVEMRDDRKFGNDKRDYIVGRSTIFAEILKSTFLRLTDILVELGVINFSDVFLYTIRNFQIDPSVWNINLSAKPKWWPAFKKVTEINTTNEPADLNCTIPNLIYSTSKDQILHLSGAITSKNERYDNIVEGSIHILPYCFKIVGPNLPVASEIYRKLSSDSGFLYSNIKSYQDFCTLDNDLKFNGDILPLKIKDLEIMPLVANVRFSIPHMWQYYRWFHDYKLLSPLLSSSLKFEINKHKISYSLKENTIINCNDFVDQIKIISNYDHITPAGNYITISKKYLAKFLSEAGLSLGYVIRTKNRTWKYSYSDDFTDTVFFDLINHPPLAVNSNPLLP